MVLARLALIFAGSSLLAQTPEAGEIMRRVAENVERAQAARVAWVYDQDVFVRLKRPDGKQHGSLCLVLY
jgi:hypothetical protein